MDEIERLRKERDDARAALALLLQPIPTISGDDPRVIEVIRDTIAHDTQKRIADRETIERLEARLREANAGYPDPDGRPMTNYAARRFAQRVVARLEWIAPLPNPARSPLVATAQAADALRQAIEHVAKRTRACEVEPVVGDQWVPREDYDALDRRLTATRERLDVVRGALAAMVDGWARYRNGTGAALLQIARTLTRCEERARAILARADEDEEAMAAARRLAARLHEDE